MTRWRLAHLSDPHLTTPEPNGWRPLASKRGLSYLSWQRRRRFVHQRGVLDAVLADLTAAAPDHIAVTGDLTHLGLPNEFDEGRRWLQELGDPHDVTVIPGNHERLRDDFWCDGLALWQPYLLGDGEGTIRFPDGWETRNTRQAVGAIARDREAQVVLEHHGTGSDLRKALEAFAKEAGEDGLDLDAPEPIKVGGFDALRARGHASTRFGGVHVLVTFIASEGHVYRVTGVSRAGHDTHRTLFMNVARSFRPLPAEARQGIQETRLRIAEARSGESLADLSKRTGNAWPLQQTAVMNDLFANAPLEPGQLVKVAIAQPHAPGS